MHSIFLSAVMAIFLTGSALSYTFPPDPSAALASNQNSSQQEVSLTDVSQNTDLISACPYGENCVRHGSGSQDCLNPESCPQDGSCNQNCLNSDSCLQNDSGMQYGRQQGHHRNAGHGSCRRGGSGR